MLVAAAAVITILLAGYFSWQGNKNLPDMYRKQFSPYLMVLSSRSGQDTDSVLRLAISSYQENRYQESAGYWSLLLNKDSSNTAARFYRGICELAQSQTQAARRDLSASGAGEASLFTEQANWYILLSFLQDNNKSEACRLLEKNRQQEYKAKEMQEIRNRICR